MNLLLIVIQRQSYPDGPSLQVFINIHEGLRKIPQARCAPLKAFDVISKRMLAIIKDERLDSKSMRTRVVYVEMFRVHSTRRKENRVKGKTGIRPRERKIKKIGQSSAR